MGTTPEIAEALKQLWLKFLPQMRERAGALENASRELLAGGLSDDQRAAAGSAAHKLAGVLGTFGLANGTALAREAEELFGSGSEIPPAAVQRLGVIARELAELIESHSQTV